jgi:hypothetical protein
MSPKESLQETYELIAETLEIKSIIEQHATRIKSTLESCQQTQFGNLISY